MKKSVLTRFFLVLATVSLFGTFSFAQEITGSIVGTVKDSAGAVVPGATVTLRDTDKGGQVVRTVTTNDDGAFVFSPIPVSTYSVTVEAPNFKKSVQSSIKVDVGQRRSVEVAMETGNIEETVTVEADPLPIDTNSATSGTVISGDQVRELSVNNRNFTQLVALAPGVSSDLSDQVYIGTTNPEGQANIVQLSVNGARSSQNTFTVDGADITDRGSNLTIQAYPSVDSIGEFRVLRSLYPAESGRSGGGQVNIVTRSGGAKIRGSAYYFFRDEALNANDVGRNSSIAAPFGRDDNGRAKRPPFTYRNYGWTLGGPIYFFKFGEGKAGDMFGKYDKTFFFFSQELRRDTRQTSANTVAVPTSDLRNGIFPIPVCVNRTFLSETCSSANVLPAGTPLQAFRYSQAALGYVNGIYKNLPLPNAPTATNPFALVTSLENLSKFRQEVVKIDHKFNDSLSAYYRFQRDLIPTIDGNALFSSGSLLPGVSTTSTNSPGRTHTAQATWAISPTKIVEGRYVYSYGAILSENVGLLALTNTQVPTNLPFANQRDRVPTLTGNGVTGLTSFGPYDNFSNKHNISGSYTWISGNHTMKFGTVYSQYRKNENALVGCNTTTGVGCNEGFFGGFGATLVAQSALPVGVTAPANTTLNQNYQRWANFLVGNVGSFGQASFDYTADLRQKTFEAYAQDEWKARRNLTLYYGVRYSFFGAPWDKNGRLTNFIPELFDSATAPQVTGAANRVVGTGNFTNGMIINTQNIIPAVNGTITPSPYGKFVVKAPKKDFAPRVGLAWDPFGQGKTAIRTGYGIYHEQVLNGIYLQMIGLNPPYQINATATGTSMDNPVAGVPIALAVQSLRAVQHDFKTPYMQHWSLDFQQQVGDKTVVTVGYYGSKGTNLIGLVELNDLRSGTARNSTCAQGNNYRTQTPAPTLVTCQPAGYAFRSSTTVTAAQGNPNVVGTTIFNDAAILDQLRPYRGYRSIAMVQPRFDSNYHSMQVSATHRFDSYSVVNMAYTWAKNLTTSINDRTTAPQDTYDIASEYQRAALDRRHILSINYNYNVPFFKDQKGVLGVLLDGWQTSGIVTYNTGVPFTAVTSNYDPAGLGFLLANPTGRPNVLCDPNIGGAGTPQQFFNTACFQANPAVGVAVPNTVGNTARGNIHGPSHTRVDFSMFKNFGFGEGNRFKLQLRAEAFNVFNKTNYRTIGSTNITSTLFGTISGYRDPRTMQLAAKFNF